MQITSHGVTYLIETERELKAWLGANAVTLPRVLAKLQQVKRP